MTARTQVLQALIAQLKSDDVADEQVYLTRLYKLSDESLPAVFVTAISEEVDYGQSAGSSGFIKQMRLLEIEIAIKAIGTDGAAVSTTLDTVATQVEDSIYNNKSLGLNIRDFKYLSTAYEYNENSESPRGMATLLFTILYQIKEPESSTMV